MKVLLVHNRYVGAGGEDTVLANEEAVLRGAGVETRLFSAQNEEPTTLGARLRMMAGLVHNGRQRRRLRDEVRRFRPDVVHFHNTFAAMGESVLGVPRSLGVPSVLTAHNYRLFCIAGTAVRDGRVCTDCVGHSGLAGGRHACYRGDATGSWALAAARAFHNAARTARRSLDVVVCLNPAQRDLLLRHGFREDQLVLKPNLLPAVPAASSPDERVSLLFVGRLSTEKGVRVLMDAYDGGAHGPLDVVGTGPLEDEVAAWAARTPGATFHGRLSDDALAEIWGRARFLVFPSIWLEGEPMVVLEALSRGIPVIADTTSAGGALAAASGGLPYDGPDALRAALDRARGVDDGYAAMSRAAHDRFLRHHAPDVGRRALLDTYKTAVELRRASGP